MEPGKKTTWKPFVLKPPMLIGLSMAFLVTLYYRSSKKSRSSSSDEAPGRPKAQQFYGLTSAEQAEKDRRGPLPDFWHLRHMEYQLRDIADNALVCLRQTCSAELEACRLQEACRMTLRHFVRSCWTHPVQLCSQMVNSGLLPECPAEFTEFWECYSEACSFSKEAPSRRHSPYHNLAAAQSQEKVSQGELARLAELPGSSLPSLGEVSFGSLEISEAAPGLLDRLLGASEVADSVQGWGVWMHMRSDLDQEQLSVRRVRIVSYGPGNAEDPHHPHHEHKRLHNTTYSLVTVAFALPSSQDGAQSPQIVVRTNGPCGPKVKYELRPGELVVFESWREHHVLPIPDARSTIAFVEFWEFQENQDGPAAGEEAGDVRPADHSREQLQAAERETLTRARRWFYKQLVRVPLS